MVKLEKGVYHQQNLGEGGSEQTIVQREVMGAAHSMGHQIRDCIYNPVRSNLLFLCLRRQELPD